MMLVRASVQARAERKGYPLLLIQREKLWWTPAAPER